MDEEKLQEIISDFSGFYNLGRLYPQEIRSLLEERCDDKNIIEGVFSYIAKKNKSPSTFCYGFHGADREGMFRFVTDNLRREA